MSINNNSDIYKKLIPGFVQHEFGGASAKAVAASLFSSRKLTFFTEDAIRYYAAAALHMRKVEPGNLALEQKAMLIQMELLILVTAHTNKMKRDLLSMSENIKALEKNALPEEGNSSPSRPAI